MMTRYAFSLLAVLAMTGSASAQAASVAVFASTAADPNTAMPIAPPVSYTPTCNISPKAVEVLPIVNPTDGFYDDPAAPTTRDCHIIVDAQISALPVGAGYKAAIKLNNGPYGSFSSAFARAAAQAHPCDSTPSSPASAFTGQGFTIGFCHDSRDANGVATTVTSWRVYRNGTLLAGVTVTPGTSANAAGQRLYTFSRTEPSAGSVTFEVAAVNTVGEGTRHALPALAIQIPPAVPGPANRGRITVP